MDSSGSQGHHSALVRKLKQLVRATYSDLAPLFSPESNQIKFPTPTPVILLSDLEVLIRVQKTSLRKEGDFNVATVAYGAASAQLHALFQALDISGDGSIDAKDFPDQGTASCAELVQLMQYCDGAVDGARDGAIDQREFFAGFVALAMNGVNNIGLMPAAQPGGAVSAATQAAAVLAASAGLSAGVSFAGSIHDAVKHVEAVMQQALATHASSLHAVANQQVAIKATAGAASAPYPFPLETSGVKTHFPIVVSTSDPLCAPPPPSCG